MPSLRDILRRKNAVRNTSKITQAMKMVAAAQLKRAQRQIESARPYVIKLEEMLSNLIAAVGENYSHPLIRKPKDVKKVAIIIVSSDRGLCGSFNTNLFRVVTDYLKYSFKNDFPNAEVQLIPVGKKASSFFGKLKYPIAQHFQGLFAKLKFTDAKTIVDVFNDEFANEGIDKVLVYYNEFVNVIKQVPRQKQILPIETSDVAGKTAENKFNQDYIFEPEKSLILNELLPKLLDIQIWRVLLESNAAEQAARMLAMDNATTNAKQLIDFLELQFNKARQAQITKEMLEIVGGAEAMRGS